MMILYASPCRCIQEIIFFSKNSNKRIKMVIPYACWAGLGLARCAAHVYKVPTQSNAPDGSPSFRPRTEDRTAAGRRRHRPTIPPPPRATSARPPAPSSHRTPPGASSRSSSPLRLSSSAVSAPALAMPRRDGVRFLLLPSPPLLSIR